jgi:endonuclease/exonuclease/phosphatase family metal-dependent hydrolase
MGGLFAWASGKTPSGAELVHLEVPKLAPHSVEPGDVITVVSWNIHYGGGPTLEMGRGQTKEEVVGYLTAIAENIREWDADIVALQEVDKNAIRSFDIDQLAWLQNATGMPYGAWTTTWDAPWVPSPGLDPRQHIGRVHSGQAILSRFPLRDALRVDLPQPPENPGYYNRFYLHRALLEVHATLGPERSVRVIDAHLEAFHPGNRQDHADRTVAFIGDDTRHTILQGDMNCTPVQAKLRSTFPDEPETDMSGDDTIQRLANIVGMSEVVPPKVYRALEQPWFTFPAHAPNRRLDYIFHGNGLTLATARVPRLPDPPSDHLPVIATFRIE